MPRIASYFNPFSKEHYALDRFKDLSGRKRFLTIVLTALATIASLPILGVGGVATFRALTRKFTVIKLDGGENRPKSPIKKTAKKAQDVNNQVLPSDSEPVVPQTIQPADEASNGTIQELPEGFDLEAFRENVKKLKTFEALPENLLDNIILEDKHKKILKDGFNKNYKYWEDHKGRAAEQEIEIISIENQWLVLAFPTIPCVVFKVRIHGGLVKPYKGPTPGSVDTVGRKVFGSEEAVKICQQYDTSFLYIPRAKLIDVGDGQQIIAEERVDCPFPTWKEQEKIYQFIQEDEDLQDYAKDLLKQLTFFTVVSGFRNTKYDKIPILPNGKVALHDLQLGGVAEKSSTGFHITSSTDGLTASCCYEEKGIFSHILPQWHAELAQFAVDVAQQFCPQEVDNLIKKFNF